MKKGKTRPYSTWGFVNSDATDINNFRSVIVHTIVMVQIAALKHNKATNKTMKDLILYNIPSPEI